MGQFWHEMPTLLILWSCSILIPPILTISPSTTRLSILECSWACAASGPCHFLFLSAFLSPIGYGLYALCWIASVCTLLFIASERPYASIIVGQCISWGGLLILSPMWLDHQPSSHRYAIPSKALVYSGVIAVLIASTGLAVLMQRWVMRRRRQGWPPVYSICEQCGYNLTGNTSGTCPECGTPIPENQLRHLNVSANSEAT